MDVLGDALYWKLEIGREAKLAGLFGRTVVRAVAKRESYLLQLKFVEQLVRIISRDDPAW